MTQHYGVDVSSNNPHPMAWPAIIAHLRALGGGAQPFVIVKIIQGTGYVNPDQAIDIAAARAAGAAVAGYLMDEGNANVAAEEALFQRTTSLPQTDDIELPEGLTVAQYIAHSHDLVNIHPNELSYLNQSEEAEGFPNGEGLWLAEFNKQPGVTKYPCWMQQYDNEGTIPGAAGIFDMDVWCGSEAQFAAFFQIAPPAPTPPQEEADDMITGLVSFNGSDHQVQRNASGVIAHFWRGDGGTKWNAEHLDFAGGFVGNPILYVDGIGSAAVLTIECEEASSNESLMVATQAPGKPWSAWAAKA